MGAGKGDYFELSLDPLCELAPDLTLTRVNSAWRRIMGLAPTELMGRSLHDLLHPDDATRFADEIRRLDEGKVARGRFRLVDGAGAYRSVFLRAEPVEDGARAVLREISAYEERDFIKALLGNTSALIAVSDAEGRIVQFNRAAERVTGYRFADIQMKTWWEVGLVAPAVKDDYLSGIERVRVDEFPLDYEIDFRAVDGHDVRVRWKVSALVDEDGRIAHFVAVGEDVTERRRLEQRLVHSQKMEAVGRLAGGVAHDFNNILSVILNHAQFALDDVPSESSAYDDIKQIHDSARRAAALTRQLLLFSRKDAATPERLEVNRAVTDLERLLRRVLGEDIKLRTELTADVAVNMARTHLEQIVINLAVNARDAMPHGGALTIRTTEAELAGEEVAQIVVEDEGVGMTKDVLEHAFEPFFTTKTLGQGTGLGLAIVYGLVRQARGSIAVDSEPGEGCRVTVTLPVAPRDSKAEVENALATAERGRGERILVVEDERPVRRAVARLLQRNGYVVEQAASGEEALALLGRGTRVELVLTDVVMPGVSGTEMAQRLQETHPDLPVIYMSGYTADHLAHHGVGDLMLLHKPFGEPELARLVQRALRRAGSVMPQPTSGNSASSE
ncbi:MAG: PAS domain S-box protein [Myxococcota bacterium]